MNPKKYYIQTYGCQMNEHDSEKISFLLEEEGYFPADRPEDADFLLLNTCLIRENAENRVFGQLGALKHLKRKKPDMILAVSGCMMQTGEARDKILESYRHVDLIFGTKNIHELPYLMTEYFRTGKPVFSIEEELDLSNDQTRVIRQSQHKAYITVAYGCDNYCSYCVVPYARGREISREPSQILEEARDLAMRGYKEITLLGQNVNSYGKNLSIPKSFASLLADINEIEELRRIRFMTSHPKDLSDELIAAMRDLPRVCEHFHLPVQSGSDRVLKAMNRKYTRMHYLRLVDKLRNAVPSIAITTDIIVGFPGETEEDFRETLSLAKEVGYDAAFTFQYSPRAGTPAAKRPDQIAPEVVRDRFERLSDVLYAGYAAKHAAMIGSVQNVLLDGSSKTDSSVLTGRTRRHHLVHVPASTEKIGSIVPVRIERATSFTLEGSLEEAGAEDLS